MRNPQARLASLALILGLPLLMGLMAHPEPYAWRQGPLGRPAGMPASLLLVCQVEPILVAGLLYANGQRRRLLAGLPDEA